MTVRQACPRTTDLAGFQTHSIPTPQKDLQLVPTPAKANHTAHSSRLVSLQRFLSNHTTGLASASQRGAWHASRSVLPAAVQQPAEHYVHCNLLPPGETQGHALLNGLVGTPARLGQPTLRAGLAPDHWASHHVQYAHVRDPGPKHVKVDQQGSHKASIRTPGGICARSNSRARTRDSSTKQAAAASSSSEASTSSNSRSRATAGKCQGVDDHHLTT